MDASGDFIATPLLDSEGPAILQSVSEQGGYAYAALAARAAAGDIRAAEAARDMAWEQLHSGPWHSVLPVWRDAYSAACLHVARLMYGAGEVGECLRVLDMGIIMGGEKLRGDLDSAVAKASAKAASSFSDSKNGGCFPGEFDKAEVRSVVPRFSGKYNCFRRLSIILYIFYCHCYLCSVYIELSFGNTRPSSNQL